MTRLWRPIHTLLKDPRLEAHVSSFGCCLVVARDSEKTRICWSQNLRLPRPSSSRHSSDHCSIRVLSILSLDDGCCLFESTCPCQLDSHSIRSLNDPMAIASGETKELLVEVCSPETATRREVFWKDCDSSFQWVLYRYGQRLGCIVVGYHTGTGTRYC